MLSHILFAVVIFTIAISNANGVEAFDVIVYGATPGGIAAALAAAKDGNSVLLSEPTIRIGGMVTNGLSHPDFKTFEALTGTYYELTQRTIEYYRAQYGPNSQQVKDSFRGTHAEPKVSLLLLQRMLAEQPKITVKTQWMLVTAYTKGTTGNRYVSAVRFRDARGGEHLVEGKIFIDGSYEGDLIASAQISYRVGVESRDEFGETFAPEESSHDLQGYNFRLIMTQDPSNKVTVEAPKGYRREDFLPLADLIKEGKIKKAFGTKGDHDNVVKAQIPVLPNGKRDINDVSGGYVRLSMPGDQLAWPEGDAEARGRVFDEHLRWDVGLIYFSQNDPAVPADFRAAASTWGWCADEFVETGHIPPQLYVREARRMVGLRLYTQHDTRLSDNDARAVLHTDSIAIGDYGHSSHGVRQEGSRFGGKRFGEGLAVPYAPYQIPYGTLVPKDVSNVLAPVPASSTHVGFCALRLEPIWSSLGQAAGHAAHLALSNNAKPDVRMVDVAKLQRLLHRDGSATIYVSDVPVGHPDFAAVQWWGTLGGYHGLEPKPTGDRIGKTIEGQYSEAWLHHAVDLNRPIDEILAQRWRAIASSKHFAVEHLPALSVGMTRGDWIRAAYAAFGK